MAETVKVLARNRKAYHLYDVEETLECGVSLTGTEVKSIKNNQFSFSDAYVRIKSGQFELVGFHIAIYDHGHLYNHEPDRVRILLAHAMEIEKWRRRVDEKGYTVVPTQVHLLRGRIKVVLGLCRGKKLADKRADIKSKDIKRETDREIRSYER